MSNDDSLKTSLTLLVSAWATEANRYRQQARLPETEGPLCLGISYAFDERVDELVALLNKPSIQNVFTAI